MKKLLLLAAGLLSLGTIGLHTAKAGADYDDDRDRRPVYRDRYDDRVEYERPRVVVRDYCGPTYYAPSPYVYGYRPYPYHRRHLGVFLPLPPFPLPVPRF